MNCKWILIILLVVSLVGVLWYYGFFDQIKNVKETLGEAKEGAKFLNPVPLQIIDALLNARTSKRPHAHAHTHAHAKVRERRGAYMDWAKYKTKPIVTFAPTPTPTPKRLSFLLELYLMGQIKLIVATYNASLAQPTTLPTAGGEANATGKAATSLKNGHMFDVFYDLRRKLFTKYSRPVFWLDSFCEMYLRVQECDDYTHGEEKFQCIVNVITLPLPIDVVNVDGWCLGLDYIFWDVRTSTSTAITTVAKATSHKSRQLQAASGTDVADAADDFEELEEWRRQLRQRRIRLKKTDDEDDDDDDKCGLLCKFWGLLKSCWRWIKKWSTVIVVLAIIVGILFLLVKFGPSCCMLTLGFFKSCLACSCCEIKIDKPNEAPTCGSLFRTFTNGSNNNNDTGYAGYTIVSDDNPKKKGHKGNTNFLAIG
jgi:hypothetical protein